MMDFDSDPEDAEFSINKSYADNYNKWRQKEELQKLKDRYQTDDASILEKSSSDSETTEDEDAEELTPDMEKHFIKTLGLLKKKDPKIYDKNAVFFEKKVEKNVDGKQNKKKKEKEKKSMYLKDYERKLITEKNGKLTDDEEEEDATEDGNKSPTYVQQQHEIKQSFLDAVGDESDNEESLFQQKQKTVEEKEKEEKDYMKWLDDQENIDDVTEEMQFLKDYWKDPKLGSDESFLRDFLINKRYLDKNKSHPDNNDDDDANDNDSKDDEQQELVSEEEERIEEFEHKYNFRFEEPDDEFIKRYPRTMASTMRRKDDKRSKKREEVKDRKQKEKEKIKEDIKLLKILKRNEILDKLEKLKEMTGNDDVGFKHSDIDGDFDPEAHDRRMQELFNDDYYEEGEENDQKPTFSDLEDDEFGDAHDVATDNWDDWTAGQEENNEILDCERPDFNMDADYVPNQQNETNKGKKKSKKHNSKFAQALSKYKPTFDPKDKKTFEQYLDEYYKLDYEDIIGDMPTRFKYRSVVPNDFGLSVEEILVAKDKDLNKWCSVKKMCQYRTNDEEQYDVKAFKVKAEQEARKKKLMPSLYEPSTSSSTVGQKNENVEAGDSKEETEENVSSEDTFTKGKKRKAEEIEKKEPQKLELDGNVDNSQSKKRKRRKKQKSNDNKNVLDSNSAVKSKPEIVQTDDASKKVKKNRNHHKLANDEHQILKMSNMRLKAYGLNPKKFKNKIKYKKK